jgi:hypothetical protein
MADRLVLGKANNGTSDIYGLWVSKPGVNVIDGSGVLTDSRNLLFDSRNPYGQVLKAGSGSVPTEGSVQVTFTARNGQTPPVFWWQATNAKLTNCDTAQDTRVTASINVSGNNGTLTFSNSGNTASVGYIIMALDE